MKNTAVMKPILLAQDPTYTQEELDGMTPEEVLRAYNDLVDATRYDPEDWAWRKLHVIANNL